MRTSYILIEAVCLCDDIEKDCYTKGEISHKCLSGRHSEEDKCEFLGFVKARAAAAVTDSEGRVVNGGCFFGGFDLSEKDYLAREKRWIGKCVDFIEKVGNGG